MVRKNWNFSNRHNEGVKLGHAVADSLRTALKGLQKKSDSRDSNTLELVIPAKNLTDVGVREVAIALLEVLSAPAGLTTYKLKELDLNNNALTTSSLRLLAEVIRIARFDLELLDLSGNNIKVSTYEEARDCEVFLDSFEGCRVMRRLDLSNNDMSGSKTFEILSKVYGRQSPVDPN
ncbi:hypothetical protein LTS18_013220, partial [Coniosporium uncinatum]